MKQEDKDLLLKDLCARLPYGVMVDRLGTPHKVLAIEPSQLNCIMIDRGEFMPTFYSTEDVKLYLRPMSSMTEEEEKEYIDIDNLSYSCPMIYAHFPASKRIDWLNAHHFDYRGLVPKGLAIEVTKENNPYKD